MPKPLKIRAEDLADLAVISACLQDAVVSPREMSFDPVRRRFAMAVDRFMWEQTTAGPDSGGKNRVPRGAAAGLFQVEGGLHFDGVLSVKTQNISGAGEGEYLELLTIHTTPEEQGVATITLVFAGGAAIRLEVECIDCYVIDTGRPAETRRRPKHPVARRARRH
mgnify:FL=1|jgi:hypothetical protein